MMVRILMILGCFVALFALGMAFYLPKPARHDGAWLVTREGSVN